MHNSPEGESSVPFLKGRRSWPPYKKGVSKFHVVRATDSISGLLKISIHDLLIGYITVLKELSWSAFRPLIFMGAWLHSGEDSSLLRTSEQVSDVAVMMVFMWQMCCAIHSPGHDRYCWQTGLILGTWPLLCNHVSRCSQPAPGWMAFTQILPWKTQMCTPVGWTTESLSSPLIW